MVLAGSGVSELRATRTQGVAVGGQSSVHLTDVPFQLPSDIEADGERSPIWAAELQSAIEQACGRAATGFGQPIWAARLVAFRQDVWVGFLGGEVVQDARRGCRLALRIRLGGANPSEAFQDLVLAHQGPWPIARAFEQALERAEGRSAIGSHPARGPATIVLASGTAGVVVHELIGHALEADAVIAGRSWLGGRQLPHSGRPVTIVDNPRLGRGAWSFDDEGVASRETILVDRGRRVGMLIDRSTGDMLRVESTGHGRRSTYLDAIRPRMGCTFIQSGDDDPAEIVRETPDGLYIRRMDTGHTDPATGRATFVVSDADRISAGRLAEPLGAFVLELDGPQAWSSIDRVAGDLRFDTCVGSCSRDGQPLAVSVGAPTIRKGVATGRS